MPAVLLVGWALLVGALEPVRVAIDLTALDEASFAAIDGLAIEQSAVTRLVQEGFAVVGRDRGEDLLLSVEANPTAVVLRLRSRAGEAIREIPRVVGAERAELVLEVVQKLVELVRAEAQRLPPPEVRATVTSTPVAPAAPPPTAGVPLELGARAGAVLRSGGLDPGVFGWARVGGTLALRAEAGGVLASESAIVAGDVWLSLGADVRFALGSSFDLEIGVLAGLLLHAFSLRGGGAEASGMRLDVQASLPLGLSYRPRPWVKIGAFFAPGLSGRERAHTQDGQVIWRRGIAFLSGGLGAGVDF